MVNPARSTGDTGLRVDARRNRARVLLAAQRAFADKGISVSLGEIARRAGVGAGTVYRHFPSKEHLLEAILSQRIERLAVLASAVRDAEDVGEAFFSLCREVIVSGSENPGLCDALNDDGWPRAVFATSGRLFLQALALSLVAAQECGAVRADIGVDEVHALFFGAIAMQQQQRSPKGELCRMARIAMEALEPTGNPAVAKPEIGRENRDETRIDAVKRSETDAGCSVCGASIQRSSTGRPARYCGAACRQKAHRQRVAATG